MTHLELTPEAHAPVMLLATRVGDRRIEVTVTIEPEYHLNDTNIDPKLGLHATRLRIGGEMADRVDFIDYPAAAMLQLPFGPAISAYSGTVRMSVTFNEALPADLVELSLSFQACNQTTCLRPMILTVRV